MLKNEFFTIVSKVDSECGRNYRISLNPTHRIFQAHFPGNPTTPGACIVQLVKELAEDLYQRKCFTRSIKNVKFLQVLNPLVNPEVSAHLISKTDENGQNHISAIIKEEETIFSKVNLVLEDWEE